MPFRRHRAAAAFVAAALAFAPLLGACGGGDDEEDDGSSPPAAKVDPNSNNTITDPINRARRTADSVEERDKNLDQQSDDGY